MGRLVRRPLALALLDLLTFLSGTGKTYTMEGNRDTEDTSQLDSKARLKASREAGSFRAHLVCSLHRLIANLQE